MTANGVTGPVAGSDEGEWVADTASHYTWLILDQDADGRRSSAVRTSATPDFEAGEDALVAIGPVTVGAGGQYASDQEAAAALADSQGIDLADPDGWDELFEETLEDDGLVII